jgi:hypothetical protein
MKSLTAQREYGCNRCTALLAIAREFLDEGLLSCDIALRATITLEGLMQIQLYDQGLGLMDKPLFLSCFKGKGALLVGFCSLVSG